jgi:signal peptidase II
VRRDLLLPAGIAAAIFVLDRWTKQWASATLPFDQPVRVLGDVLRFTYTRNPGVAFGIGQGVRFPYYLFSLAAIAVILWMLVRQRTMSPGRRLALSLILGGATGNLVDRLATGEVVDFIEVGVRAWHWPVFNVADSAVTVGVTIFALTWPRRDAASDSEAPTSSTHELDPHDPGSGAGAEAAAGSLPRGGAEGPLP